MKQAIIAAKNPIVLNLEPGNYFWCACGRSKNQPFCDGSHQGTEFLPLAFKIDVKKEVYLCQCKQSKNQPFCDGSHNNL
jgi:CDGSH-type Zn-finger protein